MVRSIPAMLTGAVVLAACATFDVETIRNCGYLHFPQSARIVHHDGQTAFGGDQWVEVVAEFPGAQLAEFAAVSKLGAFAPGVPENWQVEYWQESGVAESLRAGGNENVSEWDGNTGRHVVVQRLPEGESVRVFARGFC